MKSYILAAALTALTATASLAVASSVASLESVRGKVLLDQGKGFAAPADLASLNIGDRIFVGKDAQVAVEFDTCILSISDATVYAIPAASPCDLAKSVSVATDGDFYIEPAASHTGAQYVYKNGKKYLKKRVIKRYISKKVLKTVKVPVYQTTLVPVPVAPTIPTLAGLNPVAGLLGGMIIVGGVLIIANPVSAP